MSSKQYINRKILRELRKVNLKRNLEKKKIVLLDNVASKYFEENILYRLKYKVDILKIKKLEKIYSIYDADKEFIIVLSAEELFPIIIDYFVDKIFDVFWKPNIYVVGYDVSEYDYQTYSESHTSCVFSNLFMRDLKTLFEELVTKNKKYAYSIGRIYRAIKEYFINF